MDKPSLPYSIIWFSHKENKYDAELKIFQEKYFHWTEKFQTWDWDNCKVTWVRKSEQELRIIIRSSKIVNSEYRKKDVKVKYMLGFDIKIEDIQCPIVEAYREPLENEEKKYGQLRQRWTLKLNKKYCIWQWAIDEKKHTIESSEIYKIYNEMIKTLSEPIDNINNDKLFLVEDIPKDNRIIPVIYQPAIDSWKNFVREVHCHKINDKEYEVTILFENEHLRKHGKLDVIYRVFRYLLYRRITDIESFKIIMDEGKPVKFQFKKIFSGKHNIQDDNIHEDRSIFGRVSTHGIKYYLNDERHPIVFINTANHAMSFHDTNHKIWKWEYIPWEKDSAIIYDEKPRNKVDRFWWPR